MFLSELGSSMKQFIQEQTLLGAGPCLRHWLVAAGATFLTGRSGARQADAAAAAPAAVPVSVAVVEPRETVPWDEFSGRLEAVERVEVRSRVAGAVQAIHFREGALVKQGDLLVTIDPAPYAAEVERAEGQVAAAEARLVLTKSDLERGQQLSDSRTISQRDLDSASTPTARRTPICKAAKAALQTAQLNLDYTEVRAPVAGRVGKLEITVGNLVAAGPGAPVLTTLVSVNPIYASFNADEQVVTRALKTLADEATPSRDRPHPGADGHRHQRRHAVQGPPAADRQPGRCAQRHGAGARGVRQPRRPADARASSCGCAWASPRPSRR